MGGSGRRGARSGSRAWRGRAQEDTKVRVAKKPTVPKPLQEIAEKCLYIPLHRQTEEILVKTVHTRLTCRVSEGLRALIVPCCLTVYRDIFVSVHNFSCKACP